MRGCSVFTYGTLEVPDVMEAVTGRVFDSAEASTEGYAPYLLKGRIYPGMTPVSGQATSGRVYFGVSQQALTLLDEFEAEIYGRQLISVRTNDGHWFNAYAYIIEPKDRGVLSVIPWIREKFVEDHLASYLAACRHFHLTASCSRPTQSLTG
jgi:gamma-glutamylcyclotransferase (GGCT)/AIG2-like uncharacterized protein YtfP